MLIKMITFVYFAYLCARFNRGIFPRCLNFTDMVANEYVSVTRISSDCRSSWNEFAGFNNCCKIANEILSRLVRVSFGQFHEVPFITTQVITDGALDYYAHFVTFPRISGIRYVIRYVIVNDLPF